MGWGSKAGDWAFKGLTAGLGLATIYLTATFSVNVYRGLAWHNSQSVISCTPFFVFFGAFHQSIFVCLMRNSWGVFCRM
ncbi:hypothetical protein V6Z12_1Z009900 [Gossypium hirsutum]